MKIFKASIVCVYILWASNVGLTEQTSLLALYYFNCIALFLTTLFSSLRALVARASQALKSPFA